MAEKKPKSNVEKFLWKRGDVKIINRPKKAPKK